MIEQYSAAQKVQYWILETLENFLVFMNREEICKTSLIHGFHFKKITVDLNEPLKPPPQVFAADY